MHLAGRRRSALFEVKGRGRGLIEQLRTVMQPDPGSRRRANGADDAPVALYLDGAVQGRIRYARRWPDRVWAIEGCSGIGHHVAMRLLADDEQVVDVPPKLSARTRVFATGA